MNKFYTMLMVGTLVALAIPAMATHESPPEDLSEGAAACRRGQGWVTSPEVDTTQFGGSNYVDLDSELMPDPFTVSIWVYEEANGQAGLQRGDSSVDQTCGGHLGVADIIVL